MDIVLLPAGIEVIEVIDYFDRDRSNGVAALGVHTLTRRTQRCVINRLYFYTPPHAALGAGGDRAITRAALGAGELGEAIAYAALEAGAPGESHNPRRAWGGGTRRSHNPRRPWGGGTRRSHNPHRS